MRALTTFLILLFAFVTEASTHVPLWGMNAIHVKEAWQIAGPLARGKGVKILDIDTGIDRDIPSLKKSFRGGISAVPQGDYKIPYDLYDEMGHGSAVASTLTSEWVHGVGGVAPDADLYMAKDSLREETSDQEDMFILQAAVEWGISFHVDIINIEKAYNKDDMAKVNSEGLDAAIRKAYESGITVVVPSGNEGRAEVSYPANLPWVISVGEVDINFKRNFGCYGKGLDLVAPGESLMSTYPLGKARDSEVRFLAHGKHYYVPSMGFVRSPIISSLSGQVHLAGDGTEASFNKFPKGSLAMVQRMPRNVLTVQKQIENAINADAKGLLICNTEPLLSTKYASLLDPESKIPVVFLDREPCSNFWDHLKKGKPLSASLRVTPGNFVSFSGTSGAAPHVAGTVALMKAVNPALGPDEIRTILEDTATPVPSDKNEFGAGLINAARAVSRALDLKTKPGLKVRVK